MTDDLARAYAVIAEQLMLTDDLRAACADFRHLCRGLRETTRALVAENEALRARIGIVLAKEELNGR